MLFYRRIARHRGHGGHRCFVSCVAFFQTRQKNVLPRQKYLLKHILRRHAHTFPPLLTVTFHSPPCGQLPPLLLVDNPIPSWHSSSYPTHPTTGFARGYGIKRGEEGEEGKRDEKGFCHVTGQRVIFSIPDNASRVVFFAFASMTR